MNEWNETKVPVHPRTRDIMCSKTPSRLFRLLFAGVKKAPCWNEIEDNESKLRQDVDYRKVYFNLDYQIETVCYHTHSSANSQRLCHGICFSVSDLLRTEPHLHYLFCLFFQLQICKNLLSVKLKIRSHFLSVSSLHLLVMDVLL